MFDIQEGDILMVMGDKTKGLALVKADAMNIINQSSGPGRFPHDLQTRAAVAYAQAPGAGLEATTAPRVP